MSKTLKEQLKSVCPGLLHSNHYALYFYGSRVFGTARQKSDWDIVAVYDQVFEDTGIGCDNIDIRCVPKETFQRRIDERNNIFVECMMLPEEFVIKKPPEPWEWGSDRDRLQAGFLKGANSNWETARKLMTRRAEQPRWVLASKKSIHHSIRIMDFGIQIAEFGKIKNYQSVADKFFLILKNPSNNWEDYEKEWKPVYDKLVSDFRKATQ